jgi:hypothetical protein
MFGSWIPQLESFLSAFIYEGIVSMNSCIIVSMNSYKCGILNFSQEQISRKRIVCYGNLHTNGKDIPWKLYNYSIIEEVGFPCYLPACICGIVQKKKVCLLKRLLLTDKKDAKYRSFENYDCNTRFLQEI